MTSLPYQQPHGWIYGLFKEVNNAPLIIFRILFGFLVFFHSCHFILNGSIQEYFVKPHYIFTFIGFEFLQVLRGNLMYIYFGVLALLGLMMMTGLFYRVSAILFCVLWQAVYLVQKTNYNNHFYLILLLAYIMACLPAHRYFSVDVWRKPALKKTSCQQWICYLFIAQAFVVYFYAAINKINPGWFSGDFYETVYFFKRSFPLVGSLYPYAWFKVFIIWGGFCFDLLICPLLLWKKTRTVAFIAACCFHVFNSYIFSIGIFPYLSMGMLVFFLDSEKLSRLFFGRWRNEIVVAEPASNTIKWPVVFMLGAYLLMQLVLPLRSLFFPGDCNWTEEGHRMSWRMMLRSKRGEIHFRAVDLTTGIVWKNLEDKLTPKQQSMVATRPDIAWQFAQYLKEDFTKNGHNNVAIYASGWATLNRSAPRPLIDSTVDLAKTKWYLFKHSYWIKPLADK